MKRAWTLLTTLGLAIAIVVTAFWVSTSLSAQVNGQTAAASTELLNGAFEGDYLPWDGAEVRQVAPLWNLWYAEQWSGEADLRPPHTRAEEGSQRARSGKSQGVHSDGAHNFAACLYQQIDGLTPGHVVRFSAWAKVDEADDLLHAPDKMQTRLGIDLNGGTDPRDIDYHAHPSLWSTYTTYGEWQNLSVELHADSPTASVRHSAANISPLSSGLTYFSFCASVPCRMMASQTSSAPTPKVQAKI